MSHSIRAIKNKNQHYQKENLPQYISNPHEPNSYIKYIPENENTKLLKQADRYYWITKRQIRQNAKKLRLNILH